ncbi:MAG: hypothetical protein OXU45_01585 [Candidatus Melainabacteria bacterium]|nr:hypothetical protein [Candidatus Melainabacteria bacterium]
MQVKKEADLSEKQDQRLAAPQFSKSEQAKPIFDGPIRNQAAVTHDFSNLGYA